MKHLLVTTLTVGLLLTACGPKAPPTIDPAQVQASAMAAASTMIALTQAAMPTETPVPPTDTPSPTPPPTDTPFPLPTVPGGGFFPTNTPYSSGTTSGDDCNHLLDIAEAGPKATVLIRNDTKGQITITLGISKKNSFGQCGYLSWVINKGDSVKTDIPQGCYWGYAWIKDPNKQTTVSGSGYCMNNPDKWTFDVSYSMIKLTPP